MSDIDADLAELERQRIKAAASIRAALVSAHAEVKRLQNLLRATENNVRTRATPSRARMKDNGEGVNMVLNAINAAGCPMRARDVIAALPGMDAGSVRARLWVLHKSGRILYTKTIGDVGLYSAANGHA